jgi:GT2 family glycosyltransferase
MRDALVEAPSLAGKLLICVYDNTPQPKAIPDGLFAAETLVFQPGSNGGLPPAYNKALAVAESRGVNWLLLLDSDTEITATFLEACVYKTRELENTGNIAAIVPLVVQGEAVHSPRKMQWLRRRAIPRGSSGIFSGELIALNSGSTIRVSAVRSLGGFTPEFWLDYLDYWLFRTLQRSGFQLFVLNQELEHSLSLANPGRQMPVARYQNMLDAEEYFTRKYGSAWECVRLKLVLFGRAVRYALNPLTRPFLPLTVASIFRWAKRAAPQPPVER